MLSKITTFQSLCLLGAARVESRARVCACAGVVTSAVSRGWLPWESVRVPCEVTELSILVVCKIKMFYLVQEPPKHLWNLGFVGSCMRTRLGLLSVKPTLLQMIDAGGD